MRTIAGIDTILKLSTLGHEHFVSHAKDSVSCNICCNLDNNHHYIVIQGLEAVVDTLYLYLYNIILHLCSL